MDDTPQFPMEDCSGAEQWRTPALPSRDVDTRSSLARAVLSVAADAKEVLNKLLAALQVQLLLHRAANYRAQFGSLLRGNGEKSRARR